MSEERANLGQERARLERSSSLHWMHWLVVVASLALTLLAWRFSSSQVEERVAAQFEREAERIVDLIAERMQKYEDALWAGTGAVHVQNGKMAHREWIEFSDALSLEEKYPGINGIGVIYRVPRERREAFVHAEQEEQPGFDIHPDHSEPELLPITFIEPVEINRAAVGLDMAHEKNRYTAALRARDTGTAQMTGPIVLVQDSEKTPGFLLFVPFYADGQQVESAAERQPAFRGMVYAPFIVRKLIYGTLARERRHVAIAIRDGDDLIFDEHNATSGEFDPEALYQTRSDLELYGRRWSFDIRSDASFRATAQSHQPLIILIGGLLIDGLLLTLFILMSRASRHALRYAELAKRELSSKAAELERSNSDLEQFAYVAAHDLQEPLRMVVTYSQLLGSRYPQDDPKLQSYLKYVTQNARRMSVLVQSLLNYARVDWDEPGMEVTDANQVVAAVLHRLSDSLEEAGAHVHVEPLPKVHIAFEQLEQIFQQLLSNALKFTGQESLSVEIQAQADEAGFHRFSVSDNGIGIDPSFAERVFVAFKRLNHGDASSGTGIGLAICKRLVERHGGEIWVESDLDKGSTFYFTLPGASHAAGGKTR